MAVGGADSRLTLGAPLSVTGRLTVRDGGTLNAQGRNIAAGFDMQIGTGGGASRSSKTSAL